MPNARVPNARVPNARDGCVVPTEPLSQILAGFIETHNRGRELKQGRRFESTERVREVGAVEWLARETGIPQGTIRNVARNLSATTVLSIADPLVTAIGRPEAFCDGTLPVLPNPSATSAARAACCAGSRTGSAATG